MKKMMFSIFIITIASKIFGFLRETTLSYFFGTSAVAEAFIVAMTIPTAIFNIVALGLTTGFIPLYNEIDRKQGRKKSEIFTSNVVNIFFVIFGIMTLLIAIFSKEVISVFAIGLEGERLYYAENFLRISVFSFSVLSFATVFKGYLEINQKFAQAALPSIIMNILLIFFIRMGYYHNIWLLGIGLLIARVIQYIVYVPPIMRLGYSHTWKIDRKDPNIKRLIILSIPICIGAAINAINVIVDKNIASTLGHGEIALLNYGYIIFNVLYGVIAMSISTLFFPSLSKSATNQDMDSFKKYFTDAVLLLFLLGLPASVGLGMLHVPVTRFVFFRGAITISDVEVSAGVLQSYCIGLIGISLVDLFAKAYYALKDNRKPLYFAGVSITLNVIISILASRIWGVKGLALGTSISAIITVCIYLYFFSKRIDGIGLKRIAADVLKIAISTAAMALFVKFFFPWIGEYFSKTMQLMITIVSAAMVYGIFLAATRVSVVIETLHEWLKERKNNQW